MSHEAVFDLGPGRQMHAAAFKNLDKLCTIVNYIVNNYSRIPVRCRYDANQPIVGVHQQFY